MNPLTQSNYLSPTRDRSATEQGPGKFPSLRRKWQCLELLRAGEQIGLAPHGLVYGVHTRPTISALCAPVWPREKARV